MAIKVASHYLVFSTSQPRCSFSTFDIVFSFKYEKTNKTAR